MSRTALNYFKSKFVKENHGIILTRPFSPYLLIFLFVFVLFVFLLVGIERKQGSSALYAGSSAFRIDKGHLNPCQINSFSDDAMKATFQYTNAVPQYRRNNRGQWKKYETNIRVHVANYCCGNMHLITGTSRYRITNFQGQLGREIGPVSVIIIIITLFTV